MSLQVLVNGFDVTNGITHRINWVETSGLFDPAALVDPDVVDTFDGPYRVRQTTTNFGSRDVLISGFLIVAAPDYASKLRALDALQMIYAARPSRVTVGTLELQVDFGRVEVAQDQLKRLNAMIRYTVRGTAIPATFASTCGSGTGYTQGVPIDTSRVNEAATLASMASGVGTITNPGDVPVAAVLTIQGAASTVYYLATSATGRRVPISTDAAGVGRLDERAGLYLSPGVNRITAYSAATGTTTLTSITVMSFFGTAWQFSGNQAAGTATRMDLGPALTVNRTGSATYSDGALIQTALDDVPRIGWSWINRRNLIVTSVDQLASWTNFSLSVRTCGGAAEPFGYTGNDRAVVTMSDTTTTSLAYNGYTIGALPAIDYVASVYILKDSNTSRQAGFSINTSTQFSGALLNTSTGTAIRSTDSTLTSTVSVTDAGLWWRLAMTWTGDATANNWRIAPAIATSPGSTATSAAATGSAVFACPQVEIGTTPTAYQATDASGIALDHPANDGGLVLEGTATNLCLRSQDINNATWSKNNLTNITTTNLAPDGSSTAFQAESNAADSYITQTVAVTIGTTYTFSVWLRTTTGANTVNIYLSDGGSPISTACSVSTTWTRFSVTRSSVIATPVVVQIGGGTTWSTGEVLQIWGAQLEAGTAATSYIATTTASVTRNGELSGIVSPHNLALYSDTQTNAAWSVTGWTVATTPVAGPVSSLLNAYRINTTATAGNNIVQAVQDPTGAALKTYTFSIWIRSQSTTTSVQIGLETQSGANIAGPTTVNLTGSWQRFFITGTSLSTTTSLQIRISSANLAGQIDVYGAQVTQGYLPGRYVRTTDTQVLPTTMIDPSWSQNGYIEADFVWIPRSTGIGVFFGEGIASSGPVAVGGLRFQTDNGGPWVVFARFDSTGTQRTVLQTSSTVYNRGYARVRGEWTNYMLAGSRYMFLRIYVDGVLISETNFAGTSGSAWPLVDVTRFFRANAAIGVVSNLVLGIPALPEGARAAGI
jgi:hypothetical protein